MQSANWQLKQSWLHLGFSSTFITPFDERAGNEALLSAGRNNTCQIQRLPCASGPLLRTADM